MSQDEHGIRLDTSLGYLLKQASSALHAAMDAELRPLGVTITQYSCLELLSQRPGMSNSELARGAFVSRQSMNVLLQAMERDGLVQRATQPDAGRVLPTELTPKGAALLTAVSARVKAVEDRMLSELTATEQANGRDLLAAFIRSLSSPL